ncbi:hypothetical protein Tco_1004198 [Tanacetum coccineum]|uniref:Uncharacterized protein n=1 Tax=Tanacetum coccineum TaxID=301880 RepID=A0ABQ5FBJ0_9ASTR
MNVSLRCMERHEAIYIQSEGLQNRNSHDSHSHPHDRMDFLETFFLPDDDGKSIRVCLPKKKSKPVNQEPQSKTDLEESIIKFLDGQRVTNIKIGEWEKSQNVSSKQTDMTNPPLLQAQTDQRECRIPGVESLLIL